jgi:hypothetical protein
MSNSLRPYTVRQGDHLVGLADRFGFDPDEVWSHPKNEPTRTARKDDPHMLLPGDILYLPDPEASWLAVNVGQTNSFVVEEHTVAVRCQFVVNGAPLKGEPYTVTGADVTPGSLDGDGVFSAEADASVVALTISFPKRNEAYVLQVGHLDPPDTPSGQRMRLGMLGLYGAGAYSCCDDERDLEFGIRRFQHTQDLPLTGAWDEATSTKMMARFGR